MIDDDDDDDIDWWWLMMIDRMMVDVFIYWMMIDVF